VLGPFGTSRNPNTVRKELRNIVETCLVYVRTGWCWIDYVLSDFSVSQHREEGIAKEIRNMFRMG
jgi:hypothetical protein